MYRYCESPDFEILLFAYSSDYGPVQVVDLACGEQIPANMLDALTDESMDDAKAKLEVEQETAKETKAEVDQLLSWADCYEAADISTKHVIVARLIERIDISSGYKVHIKFRISLKQFLGQA